MRLLKPYVFLFLPAFQLYNNNCFQLKYIYIYISYLSVGRKLNICIFFPVAFVLQSLWNVLHTITTGEPLKNKHFNVKNIEPLPSSSICIGFCVFVHGRIQTQFMSATEIFITTFNVFFSLLICLHLTSIVSSLITMNTR